MKSRAKTWSVAILAVLLVALAVAYWVYSQPRTYAHFTLYSDTGLVWKDHPMFRGWGYGEKPGHQTLVIARGEDYTHQYTDWWHHEKLNIEFGSPLLVGRTDLATGQAKLGYWYAAWMSPSRGIEKQGVRGWIDIEAVGEAGVVASYDITVATGVRGEPRDVQFRGRSTFKQQPRPDGNGACAAGSLFPE